MSDALRITRRVRHDLKFRTLSVASVQDLTPDLRRIVLDRGRNWRASSRRGSTIT